MNLFLWLVIIFASLFIFSRLFGRLTRKFRNPYQLIMCFGKKGSGKSTYLCKIALQYLENGWKVFSTEGTPGTFKLEPSDIGKVKIPPDSVVLIDEVGLVWNNRDFKKFDKDVLTWFKLQRHERVKVIVFSQAFDIDKKLRDLTDYMYLFRCYGNLVSVGRRISKRIVLQDAFGDCASTIADNLCFDSPISLIPPFINKGAMQVTWIPKYAKYFDSYCELELPCKEFEYVPCTVNGTHDRRLKRVSKTISRCKLDSQPWLPSSP